MSAEQLLRFLFDSRNHAATNDRSVPPTRVRLLRQLRDEPHTITELAAVLSISRQTIYRSLPTLTDHHLVRADDARYLLTCAGSILLTVIQDFTPHQQAVVLPTLTRSKHWRTVIDTQTATPPTEPERATDGGDTQMTTPSRSTTHRYTSTFLQEGLLSDGADGYELTSAGVAFLDQYDRLVSTADYVLAAQSFLRWLPAELDDFPVDALEDSALVQNSPQQPHRCLNAFLNLIDPDIESLSAMSTIVSPPLANSYQTVFGGAVDADLLFTDDVLAELYHDPEYRRFFEQQGSGSFIDGLDSPHVDLRFVPGGVALNLAIRDGTRAVLTPDPASGFHEHRRPAIVTDDPAIVEWATTYFAAAHAGGRPPATAFKAVLGDESDPKPPD